MNAIFGALLLIINSTKLIAICPPSSGRIGNKLIIPKYTGSVYKGKPGTTQQQKTNRKVAKLDIQTGQILQIYESIALASRENNCDASGISKTCRGKRAYCGGFKWKYIEE